MVESEGFKAIEKMKSTHLSHLSSSFRPCPSHACSWAPCTRPTASEQAQLKQPNCTTVNSNKTETLLKIACSELKVCHTIN
jgi:hypothetical protein